MSSYSVSVNTRFIFHGCYHEYEGNALNATDIELSGTANDQNIIYIDSPLYCTKCRNEQNPLVGRQTLQEQSQILHWACGHKYNGDPDDPDIRKENFWDPVKDMRFSRTGWTVTHPRWCPSCIYERSLEIYKNHELVRNGYKGEHEDDLMYQLAWNMGIRQGRIEALALNSRPPPHLPVPLGKALPDEAAIDKAVRVYTVLDDPSPNPPPPGPARDPMEEIQRRLGDVNVDPLMSILSRLNWLTMDGPPSSEIEMEMGYLSELMNVTSLAPNPYTNPFKFPREFPTQPVASVPTIHPQVLQSLGPGVAPFTNADLPEEEGAFAINYHALWHPPNTDQRVDLSTDRLYSAWMEQVVIRNVEGMVALKNACQHIYVSARNRGVLYQLSQEQEVLYETEGESRTAALDRTTIGFTIVEPAPPGGAQSPPGFDWEMDDAPPPDYMS